MQVGGKFTDFQRTDTHYRCKTGKGSFNYRIKFRATNISTKSEKKILNIQIKDFDIFSPNDLIGAVPFNVTRLITDCIEFNKTVTFTKKYYDTVKQKDSKSSIKFESVDSFWLPMKTNKKVNGSIRLSVSAVTKDQADAQPVGDGRAEPNHSPFLP
jgi:hypothetical protein